MSQSMKGGLLLECKTMVIKHLHGCSLLAWTLIYLLVLRMNF